MGVSRARERVCELRPSGLAGHARIKGMGSRAKYDEEQLDDGCSRLTEMYESKG